MKLVRNAEQPNKPYPDTPTKPQVGTHLPEEQYLRLAVLLKSVTEYESTHHRAIYVMNFFRGMFFGLGVALGGTLVLAILIWVLSLFSELPWVGEFVRTIQQSIDQ